MLVGLTSCDRTPNRLEIGAQVPDVQAAGWINGEPPDKLRGKVVVVIGWATWCPSCLKSFPGLVRVYNRYHPQGVVFIGLTEQGDEDLGRIRDVVRKYELPWHIGYGAGETLTDFKVRSYPSLFIIGREGHVLWNLDLEPNETMTDALDRALSAGETAKSKTPAKSSGNEPH